VAIAEEGELTIFSIGGRKKKGEVTELKLEKKEERSNDKPR